MSSIRRVLVTGANGFVGRALCDALATADYLVRGAVRRDCALPSSVTEKAIVGDLAANPDWRPALEGVDAVLHTAALAHVMRASSSADDLYIRINAEGTLKLATAAANAGVRRVIYLSSVKVNGEELSGRPYTPLDEPRPLDVYGRSKWEGEQHLREISAKARLEAVVVRSPLVYGPGVRANFLRLLKWVDRGIPMPFGAIDNERSLVSVWNLCDLLVRVVDHPAAAGGTWFVADNEVLSTPELIRRIGRVLDRRVRLMAVPPAWLRLLGKLAGRAAEVDRLCGSLTVDTSSTQGQLEWRPRLTVDEGLSRTAAWYESQRGR